MKRLSLHKEQGEKAHINLEEKVEKVLKMLELVDRLILSTLHKQSRLL